MGELGRRVRESAGRDARFVAEVIGRASMVRFVSYRVDGRPMVTVLATHEDWFAVRSITSRDWDTIRRGLWVPRGAVPSVEVEQISPEELALLLHSGYDRSVNVADALTA